jgi:DNA polymerase-3 subunit epsilon
MTDKNFEYAVVDVETTGFGKHDRVIEIGVVLLDHRLRITDEYETLIDPQRDLGPTHVHGITPKMISMAPTFGEVASAIAKRIGNRVVVAHNLIFDERMLGLEFERMRAVFDPGEGICTLKLTKQKLPAACQMLGVKPPQHHRALADARASAELLKAIKPHCFPRPVSLLNVSGELTVRTHRRCADTETLVMDRLLSRVVFNEGDTRLLQYMDLLDWVLDDLAVTEDERKHLTFLAEELALEIIKLHAIDVR